jgi:hypothetical protein
MKVEEPSEPEEALSVASEPELVLRLMSAVVVVVAVEVKLRLWRSSAKSSSHGSIFARK